MSTLTSTAERLGASSPAATAILGALKRAWVAYITWRLERTAIASLRSMGERDLNDLGIGRSEIEEAVKGRRPRTCHVLIETRSTDLRTAP